MGKFANSLIDLSSISFLVQPADDLQPSSKLCSPARIQTLTDNNCATIETCCFKSLDLQ